MKLSALLFAGCALLASMGGQANALESTAGELFSPVEGMNDGEARRRGNTAAAKYARSAPQTLQRSSDARYRNGAQTQAQVLARSAAVSTAETPARTPKSPAARAHPQRKAKKYTYADYSAGFNHCTMDNVCGAVGFTLAKQSCRCERLTTCIYDLVRFDESKFDTILEDVVRAMRPKAVGGTNDYIACMKNGRGEELVTLLREVCSGTDNDEKCEMFLGRIGELADTYRALYKGDLKYWLSAHGGALSQSESEAETAKTYPKGAVLLLLNLKDALRRDWKSIKKERAMAQKQAEMYGVPPGVYANQYLYQQMQFDKETDQDLEDLAYFGMDESDYE